ncbi:tetratricopeptide repeat protein [Litoribacter ruber]|uniref:Tetratricopeptide repeat protein n=1 Tax=Litoribacter ruber TaxID=702568 RepID=A0AAP2CG02_9BACT|nr:MULTISPECIES: tetratricopeptide repeat protein [Litoribacter]MBS9523090.1 tetratricopeptide repeat protein [Litoribacter alkaliphilus]MBT0810747.1 tetratricopeptide repeat protein [Litoribacter ruber]
MKHLSVLFCIFALALCSCGSSFESGEAYYQSGNYEKAISSLNKSLFFNITDLKALHLRARAYEEIGDFENSAKDYKTIIKLKPTYAQAHAGLGSLAFKLKDYKTAEKHLLIASYHDVEDFDILFLLGRAMIVNENYKSAEEFLELARDLRPKEPMVYYYQGIARGKLGDPAGTAGAFNMYVTLEPENIQGLYNRGFAYMTIGMKEWALEDFDKVLKLNPKHYEAMARRGVCLAKQNPSKACADLSLAAKNGSKYAQENLTKYCQ